MPQTCMTRRLPKTKLSSLTMKRRLSTGASSSKSGKKEGKLEEAVLLEVGGDLLGPPD